jgi:hypothetical protein
MDWLVSSTLAWKRDDGPNDPSNPSWNLFSPAGHEGGSEQDQRSATTRGAWDLTSFGRWPSPTSWLSFDDDAANGRMAGNAIRNGREIDTFSDSEAGNALDMVHPEPSIKASSIKSIKGNMISTSIVISHTLPTVPPDITLRQELDRQAQQNAMESAPKGDILGLPLTTQNE